MCGTVDLDSLVFERSLTPRIQLPIFELVVSECALRQFSRSVSTGEQADQEERFLGGGRNVVNLSSTSAEQDCNPTPRHWREMGVIIVPPPP
jgi:hypothetical protein